MATLPNNAPPQSQKSARFLHKAFEVGIFLKGADGVLELLGGLLLLLYARPTQIARILTALTQHELSEDPHDVIANFLVHSAARLSEQAVFFGALYLLIHGVVKIFLVVALWRDRLWAYPVAIAFFLAFAAYQTYRYSYSHAPWLLVLTLLDIAITWLTLQEYRRLTASRA